MTHFEVLGRDGAKLRAFYSSVFNWEISVDNPMDYGLVDNAGEGIGGGVGSADGPSVTFYIEVPDVQAALDAVQAAGGSTVQEPTDIPDGPSVARFTDPEGNEIGLVKEM